MSQSETIAQFPPRDIRVMQQILDIRKAAIIRVCGHEFCIRVDQWRMAHV